MTEGHKSTKFKLGDEFLYVGNRSAEPIWLTYVSAMNSGLHRLFSTDNPTLEYHIQESLFEKGDPKKNPKPEFTVRYAAMSGNDEDKRAAYNCLAAKMGLPEI